MKFIINVKQRLFIYLQYSIPQKTISYLAGKIASSKCSWVKNYFIQWFIKEYKVDLAEAEISNRQEYLSFNHFFTRKLKYGARLISKEQGAIISPADGTISQLGNIQTGKIFQAKGKWFNINNLLGEHNSQLLNVYSKFITVYLAPHNYHRIHIPLEGQLIKMTYVPGKLFSVNPTTAEHVTDLFARNERVVFTFKHNAGYFTLVMVGALIVGSIVTSWSGQVGGKNGYKFYTENYTDVYFNAGDEIGYFKLGSTVILLTTFDLQWNEISVNQNIQMGTAIAHINNKTVI